MASFEPLFGTSSAGKTKTWSVAVVERDGMGVVQTTHGYVGSKQTTTERVVEKGKNLGKKNATTALQQAISEAESDWNKKIRDGYTEDSSSSSSEAVSSEADGGAGTATVATGAVAVVAPGTGTGSVAADEVPRPMLAHSFDKRSKDMPFTSGNVIAQRKLDGVRCVFIPKKGGYSRNGLRFPHLEHIQAEVDKLSPEHILDGELYSDTLSFQEIVGLVKKVTLKPEDEARLLQIHLCVYDLVMPGHSNKMRNGFLEHIFEALHGQKGILRLLPSEPCASLEDVKRLHAAYVAEGYEGLILRNLEGRYAVGQRSKYLQKYKEFLDEEFEITGHTMGDGVEAGCVIWTCKTKEGLLFSVRPRGTHEARRGAVATAAAQVGKKITIRFQEWTDDKKPRFPVGLAIRDYE